jgi:LmbE family N-acetylglucosaminyl deacetylase
MLRLQLGESEPGLDQVLFVGAHSDDIEIGCGGTAVSLLARVRPKAVTWVVLSADGKRETEARASAETFCARCRTVASAWNGSVTGTSRRR